MARIKDGQFYRLIANDIDKRPNIVERYVEAFIERLIKEMCRGNEVTIRNFGTFKPIVRGGCTQRIFGEDIYVEPRLAIHLTITEGGIKRLNENTMSKDTMSKCENQIINGEKGLNKRDIKDIFEIIISQLGDEDNEDEI